MTDKMEQPGNGSDDNNSGQDSPHRLIEGRLEKMTELGRSVELYPYGYDRSHTSAQLKDQEEKLAILEDVSLFMGPELNRADRRPPRLFPAISQADRKSRHQSP